MTRDLPPYAHLLGLTAERDADGMPVLVMPFGNQVLGRPGFLHGGAISGLMEMAAIVALYDALAEDGGGEIKPVNVTVDFMRGGRDRVGLSRHRHPPRHPRRQCRGDRLAGRSGETDRRGADELSDRAAVGAGACS